MPDFTCGCDASRQADELHTELANRWGVIYGMDSTIDDVQKQLKYLADTLDDNRVPAAARMACTIILGLIGYRLADARDNAETILKGEGK